MQNEQRPSSGNVGLIFLLQIVVRDHKLSRESKKIESLYWDRQWYRRHVYNISTSLMYQVSYLVTCTFYLVTHVSCVVSVTSATSSTLNTFE
jgi:hypothetical protein